MRVLALHPYRRARGAGIARTNHIYDEPENVALRAIEDGAAELIEPEDRPNAAPDNLDEMTKEDLYDIAQDKDIDGRSKMDKAELVVAVREAE